MGGFTDCEKSAGTERVTQPPSHEDMTPMVTLLFEHYHLAIFAYLCRLLDDQDLAHDLTQDTFLQVFRTRHRLAGMDNPRAWVYRVATNLGLNALKRRQHFTWQAWPSQEDERHSADPILPIDHRLVVEQVLARLSPTYRAPLLLYCHEGLSIQEVAEALNLSEAAVKVRLYRAREKFRMAYDEASSQEGR